MRRKFPFFTFLKGKNYYYILRSLLKQLSQFYPVIYSSILNSKQVGDAYSHHWLAQKYTHYDIREGIVHSSQSSMSKSCSNPLPVLGEHQNRLEPSLECVFLHPNKNSWTLHLGTPYKTVTLDKIIPHTFIISLRSGCRKGKKPSVKYWKTSAVLYVTSEKKELLHEAILMVFIST